MKTKFLVEIIFRAFDRNARETIKIEQDTFPEKKEIEKLSKEAVEKVVPTAYILEITIYEVKGVLSYQY
jgi:hypothetical protein